MHAPPVPARITLALDAISAHGAWVDRALGGEEPMVDQWEAGELTPTRAQIELLAELTKHPPEWFYRPVEGWEQPTRIFICDGRRRGENRLTIVESHVDWAGVLHTRQLTPDRPAYRPKPARAPKPACQPVPDPAVPGVCATCQLPLRNRRHR